MKTSKNIFIVASIFLFVFVIITINYYLQNKGIKKDIDN